MPLPHATEAANERMQMHTQEKEPDSSQADVNTSAGNDIVCQSQTNMCYGDTVLADSNDPAPYRGHRLKHHDINRLLDAGACQPGKDYRYPTETGRSFNPDWFFCEMPNQTKYCRNWLTYSKSINKAFCVPCIAFSGPCGSEVWTTAGFGDWHNRGRDIRRHECSKEHRAAEIAQVQWRCKKTVSQMVDKNRSLVAEDNRKVVACSIDCLRYLACEMIAFWGNTSMEGKFMNLFRLLAKRDYTAAKVHDAGKKMATNLISPGNVRCLLITIRDMIVHKIVNCIRSQEKACMIFDSTQDYSKWEASVLMMRYLDTSNGEQAVAERLIAVFTTGETTGAVLKENVIEVLQKINFDIQWLVGQCYDGAGNMRGKYNGLATLIQEHCAKATYVWCYAHRLNLVMNTVTSCCEDIRNTLGILEELYTFMSAHKRNYVFLRAQDGAVGRKQQLKRVSVTAVRLS